MFTGLVQKTGRLLRRTPREGGGSIAVSAERWPAPLIPGESVAVQGVCLTLVGGAAGEMSFDVLAETLQKTNLGSKAIGAPLNLERALRAGDAMGGHIVTGHVDGVGDVKSLRRAGRDWVLEVACPESLLSDMVIKGSVSVDGVSLTLVSVGDASFSVHLIPHTWEGTSLSALKAGETVNVETDILAKYVRRVLGGRGAAPQVSWDSLRRAGFTDQQG